MFLEIEGEKSKSELTIRLLILKQTVIFAVSNILYISTEVMNLHVILNKLHIFKKSIKWQDVRIYLRGFLPSNPTALTFLFVTILGGDITEDKTGLAGSVDDNLPNGTFIQLVFYIIF